MNTNDHLRLCAEGVAVALFLACVFVWCAILKTGF